MGTRVDLERAAVGVGICRRCRRATIAPGSRSRCRRCLDYQARKQKGYRRQWKKKRAPRRPRRLEEEMKPNKVPPMRPTKGPPVVTQQKLAFLGWVRAGAVVGVNSSWLARTLVADGLLRERTNDFGPLTGTATAMVSGLAELTLLGLVALERGRIGPISV